MTGTGRQWDWTADGWQPAPMSRVMLKKRDLTDGESALESNQKPSGQGKDVQRNRDSEDMRESNSSVRPGSGASGGTELPRDGAR